MRRMPLNFRVINEADASLPLIIDEADASLPLIIDEADASLCLTF